MNEKESLRTQRLLALLSLGMCDMLENNVISIDEAERLLFSPHSMQCCELIGADERIISMIHEGTELDSIKRLLPPEQFGISLDRIRATARLVLEQTEASDSQLDKWIDALI
jgi:hypothetical protein